MKTTAYLYEKALELKICAESWCDEACLIGNVTAKDIKSIMRDYAKLRLEKGISNEESKPPWDSCPDCGTDMKFWDNSDKFNVIYKCKNCGTEIIKN